MSNMNDVKAGSAYVKLSVDNAEMQEGLRRAQGQLLSFGDGAKSVIGNLKLLSVAATTAALAAMKGFAEFDDKMRLVKGVTGATADEFKHLSEVAGKLGDETSYTGTQVAEGMTALGRMGFNPREIENAIGSMMNLAKATGTDLASASEIAANAMRALGIDTKHTSNVADILTATANGSAQTLTDLGEALKMAAPAARTVGEDIKDVNAALGVLANVGIKGSMAGNALKRAYSQLAKKESVDFLKSYGIEVADNNGNLRKMADILRDCAVQMKDMGSADKLNFATKVFGERAAGAALALTVDTTKIDEFMAKLEKANGISKKQAEEMEAGIGGALRKFQSTAEGIGRAFGKMAGEVFKPVIEFITAFILKLRDVVKEHPMLVKAIIAVAGAVGVLTTALFALSLWNKFVNGAMGGFAKLTAAISANDAEVVTAEKTKALATETSATRRIALEKHRALLEKQSAAQSAAAIVKAEREKLAAAQARLAAAQRQSTVSSDVSSPTGVAVGAVGNPAKAVALKKEVDNLNKSLATAEKQYAGAQKAAAAMSAQYESAKTAAINAAGAQTQYTAANTTAWQQLKKTIAAEQAAKTAMTGTADSLKRLSSATAQSDAAAAALCRKWHLAADAFGIASVKILAMDNVAAGKAGWNALVSGLSKMKNGIVSFCTSADRWKFSTLTNIKLSKIFSSLTGKLGEMFSLSAVKTNLATTATVAFGVVTKTAAIVVNGLKTALQALWKVIKGNPIMAVVGAVYLLVEGIRWLIRTTNDYHKATENANVNAQRETADKALEDDKVKRERLKQLSEKKTLSDDDVAEAKMLIEDLSGYTDALNGALDEQTKTLNVTAEAWDKLNAAMKEQKLGNIDAAIAKEKQNIANLTKELDYLTEHMRKIVTSGKMSKEEVNSRIDEIKSSLKRANENQIALMKEKRDIETGRSRTKNNVENEKQRAVASADEAEKAAKDVQKAEDELAKSRRSNLANRIAEIEKERDAYKQNLQTLIEYEKAKKNADQTKIAGLEQKRDAADTEYGKEIQKERDAYSMNNRKKYGDTLADMIDKQNRDMKDKSQDIYFENHVLNADSATQQSFLSGLDKTIQTTNAELMKRLGEFSDENSEGGSDLTARETETLDRLKSEVEHLMQRRNDFMNRMIDANRNKEETAKNLSSFTAAALSNIFGADGIAAMSQDERIAKATEDTAKNTKEMKRKMAFVAG